MVLAIALFKVMTKGSVVKVLPREEMASEEGNKIKINLTTWEVFLYRLASFSLMELEDQLEVLQ